MSFMSCYRAFSAKNSGTLGAALYLDTKNRLIASFTIPNDAPIDQVRKTIQKQTYADMRYVEITTLQSIIVDEEEIKVSRYQVKFHMHTQDASRYLQMLLEA